MASCHIAHDCILENDITMANNVLLGGHVKIEHDASFGGLAAMHHFVTVGEYAFIGGMSRIIQDAPPYMMTEGNPARVHKVNVVGLQRHGFSAEAIDGLREAHRILYRSKLTRVDAFRILEGREGGLPAEVQNLIGFLRRQMAGRQGRQREVLRAGVRP